MAEADFRLAGYRFIGGDALEFYCDGALYPQIQAGDEIYITGSFNDWVGTADSSWRLARKEESGGVCYLLRKPAEAVMIPGNSGYPEFRFFALSPDRVCLLDEPDGTERFSGNKLIFSENEARGNIREISETAARIRPLSEFDLDCPACRAEISNFRPVPGTRCLFRGYHPFKRSRPDTETETARLELVRKALDLYGVRTDITLSGDEWADPLAGEDTPERLREIERNQNRLCLNIDYNLVYYHSDAAEIASALRKIARFVIGHPGPYYVHCRLGIDRTGFVCAVLACLCGAAWEEIAEDYEKSFRTGIGEYRDRRLLRFSLRRMTGADPAGAVSPEEMMTEYFLAEDILSRAEIAALVKKLRTPPRRKETDFFDFTGRHICAARGF